MDHKKISFIILLLSFILPLLIFNGTTDDFAPRHMAEINELRQVGYLTESQLTNLPEFYISGAIIELIVGISSRSLTFFPIQLLPVIFLYFTLFYKLSNSYLLSSIFVLIQLLNGVNGTSSAFFWPHGLGNILFLSILLILLDMNSKRNKVSKSTLPESILSLIILGTSLVFISYDYFGLLLIFLFILFLLYSFSNQLLNKYSGRINNSYSQIARRILNYSAILICVEFGLSKVVYASVIPLFATTKYVDISAIDKFFLAYFSSKATNPIGDMVFHYPSIFTEISLLKYSILTLSIIFSLMLIIKKVIRSKDASVHDLFITSYFISSMAFGILRLYIGQIPITLLYNPGIYCTMWLYNFTKTYRKWVIVVISLFLIMIPVIYNEYHSNNLITRDRNMFEYINTPTYWYIEHGEHIITSDQLTKSFCLLATSEYFEMMPKLNSNYGAIVKKIEIISSNKATFLVQLSDKSNTLLDKKYYLINYRLNVVSLDNWNIIKSWEVHRDKIDSNLKINKIYNTGDISIYY